MRAISLAVAYVLICSVNSISAKPPGKLVVVDPVQNTVAGVGAHGFVAIRISGDLGFDNLEVKVDGDSVKFITLVAVSAEDKNSKGGQHLHAYLLPQKAGQSKVTLTPIGDDGKVISGRDAYIVTINVKGDK